jgi:dihydrolipoamide dehydrogenase
MSDAGNPDRRYDLLVIGSGPGGYVAAIRGAQLGLRTAIVERAHLGGICLNWGCIPTKSLLHSAEIARNAASGAKAGVLDGAAAVSRTGVFAHSRAVSRQLGGGVAYLLKKNGIDVIWGEATIAAPGIIDVAEASLPAPQGALGPGRYTTRDIVIATGASPLRLAAAEPDGRLIWTYFEALAPDIAPDTLAIVGAGAIGVEFASIYAALGTKVTLIELRDRILPAEDAEIAQAMASALKRQGVTIVTGIALASVERHADAVTVALADGDRIEAARALSAAGVRPNVAGLGLEALGVELRDGSVGVDEAGRTGIADIWAIGDVAGPPMLAHKAQHQAVRCVETIAGRHAKSGTGSPAVPSCIYAHPQVASIGMTEAMAAERGIVTRIGRFHFRGNGKAIVLGEAEGFVKTVFDSATDRLVGAQMIGPNVSELIHGYTIALALGATSAQLGEVVFAHPTLAEAIGESVLAAAGSAIHA